MQSTERLDVIRRIGGATSERIGTIGRYSKVSGVAVGANLRTDFDGMLPFSPNQVELALKEVAESCYDAAGGGIEGFVKAVAEIEAGIGMVWSLERWRGAGDA